MQSYLVKVPNPKYSRTVLGVKFANGRAVLTDQTINKKYGRTVEEIAEAMQKEYGYEVTPLNDNAAQVATVAPEAAAIFEDTRKKKV